MSYLIRTFLIFVIKVTSFQKVVQTKKRNGELDSDNKFYV